MIDIPKDVSAAPADYSRLEKISFPCVETRSRPDPLGVNRAASAILKARRPVLYVGGGIVNSGAAAELRAFAEQLQLPVTPTLMGLGGFPSSHSLTLGMLGMHGTFAANMAVAESDLLIAVGVRFDDRVTGKLATFAPHAKVIHVDIARSFTDCRCSGGARSIVYRSRIARFSRDRSKHRAAGAMVGPITLVAARAADALPRGRQSHQATARD